LNFYKKIEKIKTKEELIEFLNYLSKDSKENKEEWEAKSIEEYLDAIQSWIEDMEGYYSNTKQEIPKDINWKFIATILYVGKVYE
jgi:hypothetical protein